MAKVEKDSRGLTVSLLLRIAMVVLFGSAAIMKWIDGYGAFVSGVQDMFAPSGFPHWLVTTWAWAIPIIEIVLAVWFIVGWRLSVCWMAMGFYMLTLAFGLGVVGNYPGALTNYLYIFFPIIGLSCCHVNDKHA